MSDDVPQLVRWIDEVRAREVQRGLSRKEQRAWRQGAHVRDYFVARRATGPCWSAQGKLARLLLGL